MKFITLLLVIVAVAYLAYTKGVERGFGVGADAMYQELGAVGCGHGGGGGTSW